MAKKQKFGLKKDLAAAMGVTPQTVSAWAKTGKLKGLVRKDGKVNLTKALEVLPGRIAPKQQQSINARWGKNKPVSADQALNEQEIKSYLDETIGDLAKLDIYELQRRNELEKLLMARIKRQQIEKELVPADAVRAEASECGVIVKNALMSIPDRISAELAAMSDAMKIREYLNREIRTALESLLKYSK